MPCRYPHRNLDDREFSLPAIDNVISRGRWRDWADLRRIKGVLILKRNAARDYIDFAALADRLGNDRVVAALRSFDRLYPQESGESALQQLQSQLANPLPYDEKTTDLSKYRNLDPKWHDWRAIKTTCKHVSIMVFDRVCEESEMDEAGARTGPFPARSAGCRLPSRPRAAGGRGQTLEGPSGAGGATVRRRYASARPCR